MKFPALVSLLLFLNLAYTFPVNDFLDPQLSEDETPYWDEVLFEKREVYNYPGSGPNGDKPQPSTNSLLDSQSDSSTNGDIPCTGISNSFGSGLVAAVCTEQLSQEIQKEFP